LGETLIKLRMSVEDIGIVDWSDILSGHFAAQLWTDRAGNVLVHSDPSLRAGSSGAPLGLRNGQGHIHHAGPVGRVQGTDAFERPRRGAKATGAGRPRRAFAHSDGHTNAVPVAVIRAML
jgi:hypothetical protein